MNEYAWKILQKPLFLQTEVVALNCTENRTAQTFWVNLLSLKELISNYFISNATSL